MKFRLFVLLLLTCCSASQAQDVYDPFEGFNRKSHAFNTALDGWFLKPTAQAYRAITPDPVEKGVSNFFSNMGEIRNIVNSVFQGKPDKSIEHTGRLVINSTFGLLGFIDLATPMGITPVGHEDFGQTLGVWGVDSGPYLVIPLFGPSNLRDGTTGFLIDPYFIPTSYIEHTTTRLTLTGVDIINTRASLLEAEKLLTGDKYSLIRDAYMQRREFLINDGNVEDDFGESLDSL